ncbi:hypothetical protein BDV95DRAFT_601737 [Massariosphaeria phaeospora]|uniref:F-box domain-containing protein n=1 Tax=Massariosphaeria phaeospora TaxID=100035 RepID=A0A7C8IE29_9PLEO|nr:hypothetical protein BDV95DRAFT_601737 [Massariosphaeria phaeospora]
MPLLKFLPRGKQKPVHAVAGRPHLLELPTEIRVQIYHEMVTPFLTYPLEYLGLYRSCKKIYQEMCLEFSRTAMKVLEGQAANPNPHLSVVPSRGFSWPDLMHLQISLPRLTVHRSQNGQLPILASLRHVVALHLESLTITLEDPEIADRVTDVDDEDHDSLEDDPSPDTHYRTYTSYGTVAVLITRMNCILCPAICFDNRHLLLNNICCLKCDPVNFKKVTAPAIVRKVVFELKHLHDEMVYIGNGDVYPFGSRHMRLSPRGDRAALRQRGWDVGGNWVHEPGDKSRPEKIVWERIRLGKAKKEWYRFADRVDATMLRTAARIAF